MSPARSFEGGGREPAENRQQFPHGPRPIGPPAGDDPHDGHELAALTGRRHPDRVMIGYLACLDCGVLIRQLRVCGHPTKRGTPCRASIREDLGYSACWSHGEGAGRTNTPRRGAS